MSEATKITGNVFDYKLLKRVVALAKPHRGYLIASAIFAILLAILGPMTPELVQITIDKNILTGDWNGVVTMAIFLLIILASESVIRYLFIYNSRFLGQAVVKDLRVRVFGHVINLRLKYFDQTAIGTSTTRTVNDIETINSIFTQGLIQIVSDVLILVVIVIVMFIKSWQLAIISLTMLPLLLYATYLFKESVKDAFQKVRTQVSRLNAFLQEHITGMKIIQVFGVEDKEYAKFKAINSEYKDANIEAIWYYSIFFPVVEVLLSAAIGLLVWLGALLLIQGNLTTTSGQIADVGMIVAFVLLINKLFRPIRFLAERFNTLQMGLVASERVFKLLDRKETIVNIGRLKDIPIEGAIAFRNVHFAYNEPDFVLKNLNFEVKAGETLAIVGATGSGKSSIINVLSRLYHLNDGEVLLDGRNANDYDLDFYRSQMATVLQDVFLFSGTIIDNIRLLDNSISIEKIKEAAEMIGANEFIEKLPGKYEYNVMERGATLSLGQRQLVSFIRALVFNPAILILDEATSSVDGETEALVQKAIDRLIVDRTSIIIAHRLSTIQNADKIMVLEKGEMVEFGTREELMKMEGHFKVLYDNQFAHGT